MQIGARIVKIGLSTIGSALLLVLAANAWVVSATREFIVEDMGRLSVHDVGVVLGTSPFTRHGNRNLLFTHRMMAAAELYAAGRVRHLLLSGANPDRTYNEPRKMYQALRRLGVPDSALTFDFAGFRTLDSIVRAQQVFGLERFVIVSQRYHVYRALFIARYNGVEAMAYIRPQEDRRQPLRAEAREYLARFKAVVDLFLLSKGPRFLGPQRHIDIIEAEPVFDFIVRDDKIAPVYGIPRRWPSVLVVPRPPMAYPDQRPPAKNDTDDSRAETGAQ